MMLPFIQNFFNRQHLTYSFLSTYLRTKKNLSSKEIKKVSSHLDTCSECWQTWNKVRWDRAKKSKGVGELKTYLGSSFQEYFDSSLALAKDWYKELPENPDEDQVENFYKKTHHYLYNLTIWYESGDREDFKSELENLARTYKIKSFTDYGCGVGNDGLNLVESGYKVYFVDFICPSTDFLKWRASKRNLDISFYNVEELGKLPDSDVVFAIDVLEHMPKPLEVVEKLSDKTKIFAHRSQFCNKAGGRHPFHFDFDEYYLNKALEAQGFKKVESKYLKTWYRNV